MQRDYELLSGRPLRLHLDQTAWWVAGLVLVITVPATGFASYLMFFYPMWKMVPLIQYNAFMVGLTGVWVCVCKAVERASRALASALASSLCAAPLHQQLQQHKQLQLHRPGAVRAHHLLWRRLHAVVSGLGQG